MKVEVCKCGKILYSEDDLEDHAIEDDCPYAWKKYFEYIILRTPTEDLLLYQKLHSKKEDEFISAEEIERKNYELYNLYLLKYLFTKN